MYDSYLRACTSWSRKCESCSPFMSVKQKYISVFLKSTMIVKTYPSNTQSRSASQMSPDKHSRVVRVPLKVTPLASHWATLAPVQLTFAGSTWNWGEACWVHWAVPVCSLHAATSTAHTPGQSFGKVDLGHKSRWFALEKSNYYF